MCRLVNNNNHISQYSLSHGTTKLFMLNVCLLPSTPCIDVNVQTLSWGEIKLKTILSKSKMFGCFWTGIKWDMTARSFSAFPAGKGIKLALTS